jgi:preprotein translocase subunit YajC
MGTIHALAAAAAAPAKTTGSSSSFLIIIVIFAILMIFMFRSQSRRRRSAQDTQRQVVDGARIRTTFGVYGTVIEGDDRNVIVEIAPGTRIKMLRQAIALVVPDDEPDGVAQAMPTFGQTEPDVTADQAGPDLNGDGTSGKPEDRSDLTI